jgi:uncharacterized protein YbjT (DUF2867 family)
MTAAASPRSALLAGATGLVGAQLLTLLQASPRYTALHVLVRRSLQRTELDRRTVVHVVDFRALPQPLMAVDDVYVALGTTIAVAGSQQAFREVDFDHVVHTAQAARAAGATRLAVVSALGANPASTVFYNRVKGDMEAAVAGLGYDSVTIAQPSLLVGDRAALGQPVRRGEQWGQRVADAVPWLVPRALRPIRASTVAQALVLSVLRGEPGVHRLSSAQMRAAGPP